MVLAQVVKSLCPCDVLEGQSLVKFLHFKSERVGIRERQRCSQCGMEWIFFFTEGEGS